MSLKYVRHGCLGWVAVCGLWDGGSERRWKWRLKPQASLKHCLLLLLGHLLLTHTSGISLQDLKKSKLIKGLDNKVIKDKKDRKYLKPVSSIAIPPPWTSSAAAHTSDTKKSKLIKDMGNKDNKDMEDIEDIKDRNYLKPISCIASLMDTCCSLTPGATYTLWDVNAL